MLFILSNRFKYPVCSPRNKAFFAAIDLICSCSDGRSIAFTMFNGKMDTIVDEYLLIKSPNASSHRSLPTSYTIEFVSDNDGGGTSIDFSVDVTE